MPTQNKKNRPRNVRPTHFWVLDIPNESNLGFLDKKKAEAVQKERAGSTLREIGFQAGNPTSPPGRKLKPRFIRVYAHGVADVMRVGIPENETDQDFKLIQDGSYTRINP